MTYIRGLLECRNCGYTFEQLKGVGRPRLFCTFDCGYVYNRNKRYGNKDYLEKRKKYDAKRRIKLGFKPRINHSSQ